MRIHNNAIFFLNFFLRKRLTLFWSKVCETLRIRTEKKLQILGFIFFKNLSPKLGYNTNNGHRRYSLKSLHLPRVIHFIMVRAVSGPQWNNRRRKNCSPILFFCKNWWNIFSSQEPVKAEPQPKPTHPDQTFFKAENSVLFFSVADPVLLDPWIWDLTHEFSLNFGVKYKKNIKTT